MKFPLFSAAIVLAIIVVAIPIATGGSETDLVNMSYIAIPLLGFGIFGGIAKKKKSGKNPVAVGAIAAAVSLVLLWIFYVQIWPML